jgi:hypothetical protein
MPLARRYYWLEPIYDRLEAVWMSHRVQQAAEQSLSIHCFIFPGVGRVELTLEDVDLSGLLAEAIEMVGHRSDESAGETEFVIPQPLPMTRFDRAWCREILLNLLSNALKYNDKPRKIIEVGYIGPGESHARPGCPENQAGKTIYSEHPLSVGSAVRTDPVRTDRDGPPSGPHLAAQRARSTQQPTTSDPKSGRSHHDHAGPSPCS